jgi:hypothetical protein
MVSTAMSPNSAVNSLPEIFIIPLTSQVGDFRPIKRVTLREPQSHLPGLPNIHSPDYVHGKLFRLLSYLILRRHREYPSPRYRLSICSLVRYICCHTISNS